jgi:hypothetical protein
MTGSVFGHPAGGGAAGAGAAGTRHQSLLDAAGGAGADNPGDPLNLMLRSFVPHVAIHASGDVDALVGEKGFAGGLWELLRPFGERVQGKVMIRDSNGGARAWEDFAVRFVRFGEGVEEPEGVAGGAGNGQVVGKEGMGTGTGNRGQIARVETVVERHLRFAEEA